MTEMADWNLLIGVGIGVALPAVAVILWTLFGVFLRATSKASAWSWHKFGQDADERTRARGAAVVYGGRHVRTFSAADFAVVFVAGQDWEERRNAEKALRRPIKQGSQR